MDFFIDYWGYLLFGVFVLWLGMSGKKDKERKIEGTIKRRKYILDRLQDTHNFQVTKEVWSDDNNSCIAIDENSYRICFLYTNTSSRILTDIYNFKDIMKTEVLEDGQSVIETSRGSQLVGAAVGGVLLGGAGLIVGGLSGKKTQKSIIEKIDLVITMNDTSIPIRVLHILQEKSGSQYETKFELARNWHSIISILIENGEEREATRKTNVQNIADEFRKAKAPRKKPNTTKVSSIYVADEIRKLKDLKDEGILTEAEFNEKKKQLLGQ